MAITSNNRAYTVGKYGLELQNTAAGWVQSVEGGHAKREVVVEKIGSDHLAHKHLGPVSYEEISFKCGTGMSEEIYRWIQTGFNQTSNARGREDGSILFCDYDKNILQTLDFTNALMTEFTMPALDASSKDAAQMSIKFQPETTVINRSRGGKLTMTIDGSKQKLWQPANFKFSIDKYQMGCERVNKIEAITVKQKVTDDARGDAINAEKVAGSVEVPNIVFTLPESHAENFVAWHNAYVIRGGAASDNESSGHLIYLANDVVTEIFSLDFVNLGIFKITPDKVEAGGEPVRRVKVECYCEDIKFNYNKAYLYGTR